MNDLKSRAASWDANLASLPTPGFNIQNRTKLAEIGQEIKRIYVNSSSFQNHLGFAIAVS